MKLFGSVLMTADPQSELVRHFLIEPTSKGVRLKGCSNEPVFGKLINIAYTITTIITIAVIKYQIIVFIIIILILIARQQQ